jgi:Ca2+-binding EF-hand superfamily protein
VKSCDVCDWSMEKRRKGLKFLNSITYQAQQEVHLMGLLSNGTVPNAPKLWEGSTGSEGSNVTATAKWQGSSLRASGTIKGNSRMDDSDLSSPTEIMLHWGPYKEDSVSFFSLEFAGPSMSTTRTLKYKEIFRDPEDASPDSEFRYARLIEGLIPGTSYAFRLRGFNGFGPGEYTYKVFTTRPAAPSCPRITSIASDAVTLRWVFSSSFFKHIDELKNIFNQADSDKSGNVSREELAVAFEDSGPGSCSSELKLFLHKVALKIGLDVTQGYLALFDMIEGDDDGVLSWEEFENFFMSSGWASSGSVAGSVRGSVTSLHTAVSGDTKRGADSSTTPSGLTYVVERCKNEFLGDYTEEVRTSAGQTVVHRLEPGVSYRFRVYAVNVDGIRGPSSPSVVVHAMLEVPSAPAVVLKNIGSRGVSLTWKRREQTVSSTRDKATVQKMLGDWAGTHGEDDGGVSIETAFARYDSNRSGTIELDELESLLKDLGVDASEERLRDAMATFDMNNDGVISFEEFGVWWRRDEVSYTIKRSDAITAVQGVNDRTDVRSSLANMSIRSDKVRVRGGSALRSSRDSQNNDDRSVMTTHSAFQSPTNMSVRSSSAARTRPPTASVTGAGGGRGDVPSAAIKVRQRQVAVPVVSYRGGQTKCDIAGLEPNRL